MNTTHLLSIVPHLSNELPTLAALTARAPVGETMTGGALPRWLALVLDEIDYGVLLVGPDARVLYSNHAARRELRQGHPLSLEDGCLQARERAEGKALAAALGAAAQGLRRIVSLQGDTRRYTIAVVPMPDSGGHDAATLLLLGKTSVCESLSADSFASCHGLTPAEKAVLTALANGQCPTGIARQHGVAISTVRTQIASIRVKTGATSIRDLVESIARLPPLVGVLRH